MVLGLPCYRSGAPEMLFLEGGGDGGFRGDS